MKLLVPLGLLVTLAVVGPLLAHLLRRRRPQLRDFPAARLVPTAPAVARRRAHLEDRPLLALRIVAVAALALLAASPLVRCTQLSLDRRGGASIAMVLVIDDSMSMRANLPPAARRSGATTRFALALVAARELAGSLRSGDSAAIVLGSAPAHVILPPMTEPSAVRAALEQLAIDGPSDRGTDLDGALSLATSTLRELPQPDKRVVLLSDLAGEGPAPLVMPPAPGVQLEVPLDALRATPPEGADDCAILAATPEPEGASIRVRATCAINGGATGARSVEICIADAKSDVVGRAALPATVPPAPATFEVVVPIDASQRARVGAELGAAQGKPTLRARLVGVKDAIAVDDVAPVLGDATAPAIAVVTGDGDASDLVATGGPPVTERALAALQTGLPIRPLPAAPDRDVDLQPFSGLVLDDPAGFGPESRAALSAFLERGGVMLVGLGPRAASPPLGASLAPLLAHAVRWERVTGTLGIDPTAAGPFGEGAAAATDLKPSARTTFDREDVASLTRAAGFTDKSELLVVRHLGRGEAWIAALPFGVEHSDLPLRPSFLALLDAFVARVRDRSAGARLAAGLYWVFSSGDAVEVRALDDSGKPVANALTVDTGNGPPRVGTARIGAYLVSSRSSTASGGARTEVRAVSPVAREVDLTPRPLGPNAIGGAQSALARTTADLAPTVVIGLVALVGFELLLRVRRMIAGVREDELAE